MLNDWSETPGGVAIRAALRAADAPDHPTSPAAIETDDARHSGSSTSPSSPGRPVDTNAPVRESLAISETDIRYWFG